jgi:hypothetical protein
VKALDRREGSGEVPNEGDQVKAPLCSDCSI